MSKVTLPKEVAEAIESVWQDVQRKYAEEWAMEKPVKHGWLTNWNNLADYYGDEDEVLYEFFRHNPVEYVKALVNGYEVEKSPEDKLREYIESNRAWIDRPKYYAISERQRYVGRNQGVMMTLSILGITIEGIND